MEFATGPCETHGKLRAAVESAVEAVNGVEKGELVDLFSRAYPMTTAGIPQTIAWDTDARTFDFTFAEDPARRVPDPTIVFVPAARHYPGGFVIETSPGVTALFDAGRSVLVLRRDPAEALHAVHLRPAP